MGQFDRQIATAKRLIQKNGQKVIWRQLPDISADPLKPWNGQLAAPIDNEVLICFVPAKEKSTRVLFEYLAGSEVQIGSLAGLMGEVPFTPNPKDVVIRDGVELRFESIDVLSPNGQKVLYTLEFKE